MTCHGKRVVWTEHAEDRRRERRITKAEVNQVLCAPDLDIPTKFRGDKGRRRKNAMVKNREIEVIVEERDDVIVVVSVYAP